MNSIGKTIKHLRTCKGETQEQLAEKLHISCQAVSKWENDAALPDISLLPQISDHFGITIDELFDHKLHAYTYKEKFIQLMHSSGALYFLSDDHYRINSGQFTTNAQIAKIGECFADFIRENNFSFDAILGIAHHGLPFSSATAFSLFHKYGVTTSYFYNRKVPDAQGNYFGGYTPNDGDRIIVVDDRLGSGRALDKRLERLMDVANVEIVAVIVIADSSTIRETGEIGTAYIEQKYNTKVLSLISDEDIRMAKKKNII